MRGHMSHFQRDMYSARNQAAVSVTSSPPKNPSHVFLGDSLISGVLPIKMPAEFQHLFQDGMYHADQRQQPCSHAN